MESIKTDNHPAKAWPVVDIAIIDGTRPSVRVHWVACGTCTNPDKFFSSWGGIKAI